MSKTQSSDIAQFITQKMEKYHLNISDVSRNAENAGFQLDQSYVSKVLNKKIVNPSTPMLKAFASGLMITEEEIFAAAGFALNATDIRDAKLIEIQKLSDKLNAENKKYVNRLLEMVIRELKILS